MSSRDQHSSRKRDRSPDDNYASSGRSDRRSDRDKDKDKGKDRDHRSSGHYSRHSHDHDKSRRDKGDEREHDKGSRKSSKRDREKDTDKGKGKDKDKDRRKHHRHRRSSRRSDSESEESVSGSGSESGNETDNSESEEDELIKKAKSMIKTISEEDYFTKSTEFRLWLRQAKKKYFEDLTADESRRYFRKFVKAWNNFELDESYYKGIRSSQLSSKSTTKYQWGFAKKIGKEDQSRVESIRDSIDTMTNTRFANEVSRLTGKSTASALDSGSAPKKILGPTMPSSASSRRPQTADEVFEREEEGRYRRQQNRADQKAYRKTKESVMEELVPKATGREAMLEKKRAQNAYHRQERSPDVELPEQDLMGGGDDFKSMLAAEKRRKEARESRRHGVIDSESPSSIGPAAPSRGGGAVSSVREAKQQAYKDKEEKQLEAFRQLWAQTQATKGL
ncbi:hypothetical protein BG011_006258 [Mortierella polycephala]|uniref:Uncharacterized protein n=1 Tax=Mortierella polycephala TaxID=41804 RepID=A0A9P6PWS8_9FUNG|nr:hypothetical protein BG011_006258 [Mortierella polycephala]